ncbi:hypothetical protein BsWGS_17436 [Bradybaena similaris]
MSRQPHRWP